MRARRAPVGRCARADDGVAPAPPAPRELGALARAPARLRAAVARRDRTRAEYTLRIGGRAPREALGLRCSLHLGRPRERRAGGLDREHLSPRRIRRSRAEHACRRRRVRRTVLRACARPREGSAGRGVACCCLARCVGEASRGAASFELRRERNDDPRRARLLRAARGARAHGGGPNGSAARPRALDPRLRCDVLRVRDRVRFDGLRACRGDRRRGRSARATRAGAPRRESRTARAR